MMEIRSGISNKYIIVKIYFYYVMKKLLEWWSNTRFCKIMHDKWAANIANKIINLKNGRITSIKINKKPISAGDLKW